MISYTNILKECMKKGFVLDDDRTVDFANPKKEKKYMEDAFENYLKNGSSENRKRALTARSYKNIDHELNDKQTNERLATYGDALLKLALCKILYEEEKVESITEEKKKYEEDKTLVKVVAKNYDLLRYIQYDENDQKIPKNYDYKNDSHKYIATAVEALLAAFYLDNDEDFASVVTVVREWKQWIYKTIG